jgi:hypothetical protein
MFTIIVVDLPPTYSLVLGREWSHPLGVYLMNYGSCMMLPSKDGGLTRIPRESKQPICFQGKEEERMDKRPAGPIFDGLWKLYFDGACSRNGAGIEMIIEIPNSKMKPHAYKLEFKCTNN